MKERRSLYSSTASENAIGCRLGRMVRSFFDNTRGRGSEPRGLLLLNLDHQHSYEENAGAKRRCRFSPCSALALVSIGVSSLALSGCGMSSLTSGLGFPGLDSLRRSTAGCCKVIGLKHHRKHQCWRRRGRLPTSQDRAARQLHHVLRARARR